MGTMRLGTAGLLAFLVLAFACSKKQSASEATKAPSKAPASPSTAEFKAKLSAFPKSEHAPLDRVADTCFLVINSEDPDAWRKHARDLPWVQAMLKTAMGEELQSSRMWNRFASLETSLNSLSDHSFGVVDTDAFLRGPTLGALCYDPTAADAAVHGLMVKSIREEDPALLRYGARLASRFQDPLEKRAAEVSGLYVRAFQDQIVASNRVCLIDPAHCKPADPPAASKPRRLPPAKGPGLDLWLRVPSVQSGVATLGFKFASKAGRPNHVRILSDHTHQPKAKLLRYAPIQSYLAMVPANAADPLAMLKDLNKPAAALSDALKGRPAALVLGARDLAAKDDPSLAALYIIPIEDPKAIAPQVTRVIQSLNAGGIERIRTPEGDLIIGPRPDAANAKPAPAHAQLWGFSAAITPDALIFAWGIDPLRRALAAGRNQGSSLADRIPDAIDGKAEGVFFLDTEKASHYLADFSASYLQKLSAKSDEASKRYEQTFRQGVLPSLEAVGQGGAWVAELESQPPGMLEGALVALP